MIIICECVHVHLLHDRTTKFHQPLWAYQHACVWGSIVVVEVSALASRNPRLLVCQEYVVHSSQYDIHKKSRSHRYVGKDREYLTILCSYKLVKVETHWLNPRGKMSGKRGGHPSPWQQKDKCSLECSYLVRLTGLAALTDHFRLFLSKHRTRSSTDNIGELWPFTPRFQTWTA